MEPTLTARARRWRAATLPVLIVTAPLIGMSFQGDERPRIYSVISRYGSNPFKIVRGTYREIDFFLSRGNFRPVGRLFETIEHSFVFEAGEATGLAPHVVHGVVRMLMVMLLALVATSVVAALARSAQASVRSPVNVLYPLALGTVLVASGSHGPDAARRWYNHITLVHFPHTLIGSVTLILVIALVVARAQDMQSRELKGRELVMMAMLGGIAAVFYDLVYLAPALAAVFILARAIAAGLPVSKVLATAAARRWAALTVGFLVVFVPVRVEIARRCGQASCYNGTDVGLSLDALGHIPRRLAAGTPLAGWSHNAELAQHFGIELGVRDLSTNALTAVLLAAVAAIAVAAVRSACKTEGIDGPTPVPGQTSSSEAAPPRLHRLALALALFGTATATLAALIASLSTQVQQNEPRMIDAWRETLLTQVAWSFLIAAGVAVASSAAHRRKYQKAVVVAAAVLLASSLAATLLANWRMAQTDRVIPLSAITSQISAATINLDTTEEGNLRRCSLMDAYSILVPEHLNMGGPALQGHLDRLMLQRHGWPFCDQPRPRPDPP